MSLQLTPLPPVVAVTAVLQRIGGLSGTLWVGIDGKGASGKTSFATRLAERLPTAAVIHIDDFARPELSGWERDRFVEQVLTPIRSGRPGRYQRWDYRTDRCIGWSDVPLGEPIIVEGVSATDVRLGVPWACTVWVEAPAELRLHRARERDGEEMMHRWLTDWMPSEDAYEAAQRPQDRVDLVVDGGSCR
ncbi:hypothetical protein GCM10009841_11180 [Microlunatus panaciterrae]|uniref:Uridine kinase n=1 Tax=Microlunatus panaciterrae TaxID=400768 RepID=A0ABS2RKZ5_9ACTN|nr:AAA family ATPase [Microlunatus panaciterrae]MBM7799675.1 uridine kinase [Microlunatus panaciterrae]